MKTRLLLLFLLLIVMLPKGFSQVDSTAVMSPRGSQLISPHSPGGFVPNKFNTTVRMGSQFSSTAGFGSAFSTFIIPEVSYGLSKRVSITGGIGLINTTYTGIRTDFLSEEKMSDNLSTGLVYLSGRYLLNEKVVVTGSAYKLFDLSGNAITYPYRNQQGQGFNLNVDYKLAEGVHLQAGFGYHQQSYPFRSATSPLYRSDPFSNDLYPFP